MPPLRRYRHDGKINGQPGKEGPPRPLQLRDCKKQFTVTVGTVFESSHIPLHKWLQAAYLLNSSKKGISAKQIAAHACRSPTRARGS